MKSEKEVLSSILKTAQMGQVGIRAVMPMASRVELQNALHDQLTEYNSIEGSAQKIARTNGWQLKGLDPVAKKMSQMYAKFNLSYGNVDSKIAAMMIQGNMRGLIKGIKNAPELVVTHWYEGKMRDQRYRELWIPVEKK